jgi:hypothetical protein
LCLGRVLRDEQELSYGKIVNTFQAEGTAYIKVKRIDTLIRGVATKVE